MLRWDHALRPEERWDVALYLWLLPFDQDSLVAAAQYLEAECADCHDGAGTPPLAQPENTTTPASEATIASPSTAPISIARWPDQ